MTTTLLKLPKFLFINGPPGSGKSTLAELICASHPSVWRESFAEPIRQMLWAVWYPDNDPMRPTPDLRDSAVKASYMPLKGSELFPPFTHREEMIAFSEDFMKHRYGERIFGKLLLRRVASQEMWYDHFIIDDSGFVPETQEIIDATGKEHCCLIRLHRAGYDFRGDSRSYITLPGTRTIDLQNSGSPTALLDSLAIELGHL